MFCLFNSSWVGSAHHRDRLPVHNSSAFYLSSQRIGKHTFSLLIAILVWKGLAVRKRGCWNCRIVADTGCLKAACLKGCCIRNIVAVFILSSAHKSKVVEQICPRTLADADSTRRASEVRGRKPTNQQLKAAAALAAIDVVDGITATPSYLRLSPS